MTVGFTQFPTYPLPNKPMRIGFSGVYGNYVRVYVTDAPRDSEWYGKLQAEGASQVLVHRGGAASEWVFTPDVPGKYVVAAEDISRGATGYGGGWHGSTDGHHNTTINDTTTGVEIIVGSKLEMPIGAGQDTATLRLYIWDETIRETNEETHGEATPGIFEPSSERAENAARATAVVSSLASLVDQLTSFVLTPPIDSVASDYISKLNAHMANVGGAWHAAADADNPIDTDYASPETPDRLAEAVDMVQKAFDCHARNDATTIGGGGPPYGTGTGAYHSRVGWEDLPRVLAPSGTAAAVNALGDFWQAYEAHRANGGIHAAADTNNALATLPPLLEVFRYFYAALSLVIPTPHATDNDGAKHLAAAVGMNES